MKQPSIPVMRFLQSQFPEPWNLSALVGDASHRKYFRLGLGEDSYIVMLTKPFSAKEDSFIQVQKSYEEAKVHVPKIKAYSEKLGVVVLEDLQDVMLETFAETKDPRHLYKKAIDELMKVHFQVSKKCIGFQKQFDVSTLMWELHYTLEHFIGKKLNLSLGSTLKKNLEKEFFDICQKLSLNSKYLCHRDYHSRNLMVCHDEVFVIDFQDSRKGPLSYDLVSLLKDPYCPAVESLHDELYNYFLSRVQEFCCFSYEEFKVQYQLQTLQRCFKICGNYAAIFNLKQDPRYLPYIPSSLQSFQKALEFHPQYTHCRWVLEKIHESREELSP